MAERIIKVKVAELVMGDIVAKDVYSSTGSILVTKNTDVDETVIKRLLKSYNDCLFVYRKFSDYKIHHNINIKQIVINEVEDIIDQTTKKFLKQNTYIDQIKKVIFDILNSEDKINLLVPLKAMGESVFNHSIKVALYALSVGKEMHLPYNRLVVLGTAALYHDIGMQKIPRAIIFKNETLTDKEKELLQLHPRLGFEILQKTNKFNLEISSVVLQHHERYDGKGYPNGLKSDKINMLSKIINMCDMFDALTSDRPYRQKFEKTESIEYVLGEGNNHFDPEMKQALINTISIYSYGQWVELSNGEIGIISSQEEDNYLNYRPRVAVLLDSKGQRLETQRHIDLSLRSNHEISISRII